MGHNHTQGRSRFKIPWDVDGVKVVWKTFCLGQEGPKWYTSAYIRGDVSSLVVTRSPLPTEKAARFSSIPRRALQGPHIISVSNLRQAYDRQPSNTATENATHGTTQRKWGCRQKHTNPNLFSISAARTPLLKSSSIFIKILFTHVCLSTFISPHVPKR